MAKLPIVIGHGTSHARSGCARTRHAAHMVRSYTTSRTTTTNRPHAAPKAANAGAHSTSHNQKDNQMNNQRALAAIGVATMIALAIPGQAAATVATATPSCAGLAWSVTHYSANQTNSITVKVDGATVYHDPDFGASDVGQVAWSPAGHAWSVTVDAAGTQYDKVRSGTWQACTAPTTVGATTTTVATTVPSTTVVVATTVPPAVPDVTDTTTVVTDPTTTVVAVGLPPVPSTAPLGDVVSLVPVEPVLPRTGGVDGVLVAAGLVALGTLGAVVARRRP